MKTTNTYWLIAINVLFIVYFAKGQTPITGKVIELETDHSNSQSWDYRARDMVRLKPGFHYGAVAGKSFHAGIDQNLVLPVDYVAGAPTAIGRTLDYTMPVGSIPGNADVTSTGGATYQVPIHIPPGTAGMQPQISLVYNSQSGNGIAGWGWNIAGLSIISRQKQDIFHHAVVEGVDLVNDRFALDGNLLIATIGTSGAIGTYGANGTVYHTELETFNQITSNGTSGTGPQWFEVLTKQGLIMEFGNSADSRFMDEAGTNVLFWRINKIRDLNGNYIEYKYNNDNRESRIVEIKYTGNTSLDPYNSIKFYYSERDDKNETWIAGHSVKNNIVLRMIRVYAEGVIAKEYVPRYFKKNNYSFLVEVYEYNGPNRRHFNSTVFQYGDNTSDIQSTESYPLYGLQTQLFTGDYNGDGFSDILTSHFSEYQNYFYNYDYAMYLNSESGGFSQTPTTSTYYYLPDYSEILDSRSDFNGNGKDEIAISKFTLLDVNGDIYAKRLEEIEFLEFSNGSFSSYKTIYFSSATHKRIPNGFNYFYPGDFNGDGSMDFLTVLFDFQSNNFADWVGSEAQANLYFPSLSDSKITLSSIDVNLLNSAKKIIVLDFDGDGKHELMLVNDNGTNIYSFIQNGAGISTLYSNSYPNSSDNAHIFLGDFNGDMKTDLLTFSNAEQAWKVAYSTGVDFQKQSFPFSGGFSLDGTSDILKTGDYNGDGKSDVMHAIQSGTNSTFIDIYYSNGKEFNIVNSTFAKALFNGTQFNPFEQPPLVSGDFNVDGKLDEIHPNPLSFAGEKIDILSFNPNARDFLLQSVSNGINYTTKFEYNSRSSNSNLLYNKQIYSGPIYVVKKMTLPNSKNIEKDISFIFTNAIINRQGKGFVGFEGVKKIDLLNNKTIDQQYLLNTSLYHIAPSKFDTYEGTNQLGLKKLSSVIYTPAYYNYGNKRFFPYISESLTTKFFPPNSDQAQTETITETFTYDSQGSGNVEENFVTYKDMGSATTATIKTENQFTTFGSWWIPSRLSKSTVTMHRPGGDPDYVRVIEYPSYNSAGQPLQQITDPAKAKKLITNFDYGNPFGNLKSTTVIADANQITNSVSFDPKGRFIITNTNEISQSSTAEYEPVYGNVIKQTGIDGLITIFNYDAFGRIVSTTSPNGNTATVLRDWIQNWIPDITPFSSTQYPVYFVQTNVPGAPGTKTAYNIIGQEVRKETKGLNDNIIEDKEYDDLSRVKQVFMPYYDGAVSKPYTEFQYDANYGYLKKEILSGTSLCSSCSSAYDINFKTLTTTIINSSWQTPTQTTNSLGEIITATDNGGSISYTYFPSGLAKSITTNGTVVSMKYDEYGRQTELTDPNAGTILYEYNSLGQLFKQTDARGNLYTMNYDLLGRIVERENATEGATTWQYINSGNGLNKVKRIAGTFSRTDFEYDNLGRATKMSERISGTTYDTRYTYDQFSRISQITYPTAYSAAPGFKIENTYNNDGYLTNVKNANTNAPIWELTKMNALGQPTEYNYGGNIICEKIFDELGLPDRFKAGTTGQPTAIQNLDFGWNYPTGNLIYRADDRTNFMISENFAGASYDNLNRLLKSEVAGQTPVEINYYPNGNIQNKTNIGSYSYDGDKLNAVEQVGNIAGDISTFTQNIEYTTFNKVSKITEGNYLLQIGYGPDRQRRQSALSDQTGLIHNVIYSGNYEKQTADDGNTYEVNYLSGGAINVRKNGDAASDQLFYVYTDHLGSFNTITNSSGTIVHEQNFDAWGRKRDPAQWDYDFSNYTPPTLPAGTHDPKKWLLRGFTGHEHLDEFALINMNGRVYDPLLGRMLSPDNFVQVPNFTQSYNRYSYAYNNPLVYTDPTGNEIGYNWEGYMEYTADYSDYSSGPGWLENMYREFMNWLGNDVGINLGDVTPLNDYQDNPTYDSPQPGYSEYTSEEDINDFYSRMPNNDAGAGNNMVEPANSAYNVILYNPQFINLPEGNEVFIDWASPDRTPGLPTGRINFTSGVNVQPVNGSFATMNNYGNGTSRINEFVLVINPTAVWDVKNAGVSSQAFENWEKGNFSKSDYWDYIYFRVPEFGAYPNLEQGSWRYGYMKIR